MTHRGARPWLLMFLFGLFLATEAAAQQNPDDVIDKETIVVACQTDHGPGTVLSILVGDGGSLLTTKHGFPGKQLEDCIATDTRNWKSKLDRGKTIAQDLYLVHLATPAGHPGAVFAPASQLSKGQTVLAFAVQGKTSKLTAGQILDTQTIPQIGIALLSSLELGSESDGGGLYTACGEVAGIVDSELNSKAAIGIESAYNGLKESKITFRQSDGPCSAPVNTGGAGSGGQTGGEGQSGQPAPSPENNSLFIWMVLGAIGAVLIVGSNKRGRNAAQNVYDSVSRGNWHRDRRATLVCINGPLIGARFPLRESDIVIGRDPSRCQVVLPADTSKVSRRHCLLHPGRGGSVLLTDCDSSNGTFLESGERLLSGRECSLRAGDRFFLGDRSVLFAIEPE